jgi:hypothetical protein
MLMLGLCHDLVASLVVVFLVPTTKGMRPVDPRVFGLKVGVLSFIDRYMYSVDRLYHNAVGKCANLVTLLL